MLKWFKVSLVTVASGLQFNDADMKAHCVVFAVCRSHSVV